MYIDNILGFLKFILVGLGNLPEIFFEGLGILPKYCNWTNCVQNFGQNVGSSPALSNSAHNIFFS